MISCIFWFTVKFFGIIGTIRLGFELYEYLMKVFIMKERTDLSEVYGRGTYAVISGAANGIGFGFAKEFAIQGFNLILIDLDTDGLKKAKAELVKLSPLKNFDCITLTKNYCECIYPEFFKDITPISEGKEISILVNNVGMGVADMPGFPTPDEEDFKRIMLVNCHSQVAMLKHFLPKIKNRALSGKRCAVIAMSSASALLPYSPLSCYGATKLFNHFMNAGCGNLYTSNIDWLSCQPGYIRTPLVMNSIGSRLTKLAEVEDFVKSALKSLGKFGQTCGWSGHVNDGIVNKLIGLIPSDLMVMDINNSYANLFIKN